MEDSNINNKRNALSGFITITLVAVFTIALIYLPFTKTIYEQGIDDYEYLTYYFGYWEHFKNGATYESGGAADLSNFLIASPILIIIALVFSLFVLPSLMSALTKNHSFYRKHRRIFGILTCLTGLLGFIGVLLQVGFYNLLHEGRPEAKYGIGFIIAIIVFLAYILLGLVASILALKVNPN